jgi:hypothetical protein
MAISKLFLWTDIPNKKTLKVFDGAEIISGAGRWMHVRKACAGLEKNRKYETRSPQVMNIARIQGSKRLMILQRILFIASHGLETFYTTFTTFTHNVVAGRQDCRNPRELASTMESYSTSQFAP